MFSPSRHSFRAPLLVAVALGTHTSASALAAEPVADQSPQATTAPEALPTVPPALHLQGMFYFNVGYGGQLPSPVEEEFLQPPEAFSYGVGLRLRFPDHFTWGLEFTQQATHDVDLPTLDGRAESAKGATHSWNWLLGWEFPAGSLILEPYLLVGGAYGTYELETTNASYLGNSSAFLLGAGGRIAYPILQGAARPPEVLSRALWLGADLRGSVFFPSGDGETTLVPTASVFLGVSFE